MSWLSRQLAKLGSLDAMTDRQTGTVYYVGVGGDNAKDGKTWTNRRLTIVSGYGLCANGDTLIIGPGTFTEDLTLDTDGVTVIGAGIGAAGALGGTNIKGTITLTAGRNIFKGIVFSDTGAASVVVIGNDANSNYNSFIDCKFSAGGDCIACLHIDGTAGGTDNLIKSCIFDRGDTANIIIDGGAVSSNIIQDCLFEVDSGANGHGIHINHANAIDNIIKNCVFNGNGSTGTGIYIQAGADNYVIDCVVRDCTTPYSIAANNYFAYPVGDWMTENLPTADSADNDHMADVIGNKTDTHDGDSIAAMAHILEKHIHSASKVYPTLVDGIVVTSHTSAWRLGDAAIIVGITKNIDNGDAVDLGGGHVRIPITGHGYGVGSFVTIAGTVNYNGTFEIVSNGFVDYIVIESAFVSETFVGGGAETVIDVILSDFDIHYLSIENLSANGVYEIVLYDDGTEVGRVRCTKNAAQDGTVNVPIQTPIIAASSVITAKTTSNNAAEDTVTISMFYHTY